MKKNFFVHRYCFVLAVVALSFGACRNVFAAASFERNLYVGLRADADVTRLQEFLASEGYFHVYATGNFFELTRQAVAEYQKANGITPSAGYFGPKTRSVVNIKLGTITMQPTDQSTQIALLQKQILNLQKQLDELLASPATNSPAKISEGNLGGQATTTPTVTVPTLPNPFPSTLKFQGLYPSGTLSSYTNATLHEFRFTAQEKIAIKRLKFKNNGTLADNYITNIRLVNSNSGKELVTVNEPINGVIDFVLKEDPTKLDKGLMVSGGTYYIVSTIITPSYGEARPKIRLDLEVSTSIEAFDYDDLIRKATLKEMMFSIEGPQITI